MIQIDRLSEIRASIERDKKNPKVGDSFEYLRNHMSIMAGERLLLLEMVDGLTVKWIEERTQRLALLDELSRANKLIDSAMIDS